jgi:hypothetical protein
MSTRTVLAAAAMGCIAATATSLPAQNVDSLAHHDRRWELLATSGAVVPIGAQRNAIKTANLSAAQLTYVVRPALAITAMVGWARTRDITSAESPKLDAFTYDVGAEVRANRWNASQSLTLRPFAGAGVGARSYNYRSLDVDATHNIAAYGSAGGELGYRRVALRIEARDYVTGFKPLSGIGSADRRNDVMLMGGLRITSR